MKIYAKFDENGFPVGFYPEDVYKEQPEGAIEITENQWREFLENQGRRKWNGDTVIEHTHVPTDDELAAAIRARRDALISETDYLLMPDYPISEEALAAVKAYRQALRDITAQETFPASVMWPEKPEI